MEFYREPVIPTHPLVCHTDEPQQEWRICVWVFHLFVGWLRESAWSLVPGQLSRTIALQQAAQHCFNSAIWFGVIYSSLVKHSTISVPCDEYNCLSFNSYTAIVPCMHEYTYPRNTYIIIYNMGRNTYIYPNQCLQCVNWLYKPNTL